MNIGAKQLALVIALCGHVAGCSQSQSSNPADGSDAAGDLSQAPDGGAPDLAMASAADRCQVIRDSVTAAGFDNKVVVTCDANNAYLTADTYPDHDKMNGIIGTNEQVPVPAPGHSSPVLLAPSKGTGFTFNEGPLGVAVNGVPIFDYTTQAGNPDPTVYDPRDDAVALGQLDVCSGHSGRGDDYHYHASPKCMIAAMKNKGAGAILGWGFDGYPLYGNTNPDGSAIAAGELDACNGKADATFGYRYHTSDTHPYIFQCLVGKVDSSTFPRVPPLTDAATHSGKTTGLVPQPGVQNLKFVEGTDGTRTMTYSYQGKSYSIQYKPSASGKPNCWDFTQTTYTSGGVTQNNTYCR